MYPNTLVYEAKLCCLVVLTRLFGNAMNEPINDAVYEAIIVAKNQNPITKPDMKLGHSSATIANPSPIINNSANDVKA